MFQKNNKYGSLSKRGKSKFSKEVKVYLEETSHKLIQDLNIQDLTSYEKIQFLRVVLPYILPKKKEISSDVNFVDQQSFQIEIIDKTEDVVQEE